jgi:hypothetical protein
LPISLSQLVKVVPVQEQFRTASPVDGYLLEPVAEIRDGAKNTIRLGYIQDLHNVNYPDF